MCFSWNICVCLQILQRSFEVVEAVNFLSVETLILQIIRMSIEVFSFFNENPPLFFRHNKSSEAVLLAPSLLLDCRLVSV